MTGKRIRYILHAFDVPFGGVQQSRRHVRVLNELGYDAKVVIDSDKDAHFYGDPVPRIFDRDFNATIDDICVVPEGWRKHALELSHTPAHLICYCQNHFYLNRMFARGESFETFRIRTVACCSRQTANFVERIYDADHVAVIPCAVDPCPKMEMAPSLAIAYMPRKAAGDVQIIHDIFRRKYPVHAGVKWVAIDRLSNAESLSTLRRCAVFLSMSYREGFGLPPVEAMSAGALVVGFHGGGGLDYATPRNGLWCVEGDLMACADELDNALNLLRSGRGEGRDMIAEGRRTAACYEPQRMAEALVAFWKSQTV